VVNRAFVKIAKIEIFKKFFMACPMKKPGMIKIMIAEVAAFPHLFN
jgi:hypothetical protein